MAGGDVTHHVDDSATRQPIALCFFLYRQHSGNLERAKEAEGGLFSFVVSSLTSLCCVNVCLMAHNCVHLPNMTKVKFAQILDLLQTDSEH